MTVQREHANWRSFPHEGQRKYRMVLADLLMLDQLVFRIGHRIENLYGRAFEQRAPDGSLASRCIARALGLVLKGGRKLISRLHPKKAVASWASNTPHIGLAQFCRRLDQGIEHSLQIEGRAADDLEHVGGGGLLLQRLAQLVEQSRVLDGDHRLGGKVRHQLDLLLGKGAYLLAINSDHSDKFTFLKHRHTKECTNAGDLHPRNRKSVAVEVAS